MVQVLFPVGIFSSDEHPLHLKTRGFQLERLYIFTHYVLPALSSH